MNYSFDKKITEFNVSLEHLFNRLILLNYKFQFFNLKIHFCYYIKIVNFFFFFVVIVKMSFYQNFSYSCFWDLRSRILRLFSDPTLQIGEGASGMLKLNLPIFEHLSYKYIMFFYLSSLRVSLKELFSNKELVAFLFYKRIVTQIIDL